MVGKYFKVQMEGRADPYKRTWYKNYIVNDWLNNSRYCVSGPFEEEKEARTGGDLFCRY